jgi:hypothetical protein
VNVSRREEWQEQVKLATMLARHCDPATSWWTAHDTVAPSKKSGAMRKKRGVRAGLPDTQIVHRGKPPIFIEMKSSAGIASPSRKQVCIELLAAGAHWWMARSANAAMMALRLSGVRFRKRWLPPKIAAWEGPFSDPTQRLPQAPDVAARQRAARKRWPERQQQGETLPPTSAVQC